MVLIPIVGLAFFAVLEVNRKRTVAAEMEGLMGLVNLAFEATNLIDAFERERGLVAVMLAGSSDEDVSRFSIQRDRTDELISSFRKSVAGTADNAALSELMTVALEAIDNLEPRRKKIGVGLSSMQEINAYSDTINAVLPIMTALAGATTQDQIKSMLSSVEYLAQLRVSAGLEQTALNVMFSMDFADPGMVMEVVGMVARQKVFEEFFLAHGSPGDIERFQSAMAEEKHQDFNQLRNIVTRSREIDEFGIDPLRWWRASSKRIGALSEVSSMVAEHTLEQMTSLRGAARQAAWISSLLAFGAILAAVILSGYTARSLSRSLTAASTTTQGTVNQIISSVQQLSASTGETATAMAETSTTIDELRQTSITAAAKAQATSDVAQGSKAVSEKALDAVAQGAEAMQSIREGVEGIAHNIVELNEKTVRIGEIVETVKAIAEQSNLLAVNASIEAAKAGEQGLGFSVVAGEVRALAERSKEATDEIRTMLSEIERSSNAAVMTTEQGVKRVEQGNELIGDLGETIDSLARIIEDGADATSQISLTSAQQLTGIEQITEALKSVAGATADNAAGAQQLEKAADQVMVVSRQLAEIVEGRRIAEA
ncbi:MAG: methyl-accepting chemotaxis protein [Thermoanaerobaculales bacterium]